MSAMTAVLLTYEEVRRLKANGQSLPLVIRASVDIPRTTTTSSSLPKANTQAKLAAWSTFASEAGGRFAAATAQANEKYRQIQRENEEASARRAERLAALPEFEAKETFKCTAKKPAATSADSSASTAPPKAKVLPPHLRKKAETEQKASTMSPQLHNTNAGSVETPLTSVWVAAKLPNPCA